MKVNVTATRCIVENDVELNAGEYNINKFYFTFSPEYLDNYVKKALFVAKDKPPIEMVIANDECNIPNDILKKPGVYMVGVYAYEIDENNELILRYSPEPTHFYVNKGSYIENAESPTEPDPDEFAQYYQAMQELVANAKPEFKEYIDENLPTVEIGSTTTLQPGSPATVTNSGTDRHPVFNFGIPEGLKGDTIKQIEIVSNDETYQFKIKIYDDSGKLISESNMVDLPIEIFVKNTDYATENVGGVIKSSSNSGFVVDGNTGKVSGVNTSYSDLVNKDNKYLISKGTLDKYVTGKRIVSRSDYADSTTAGVVRVGTNADVDSNGYLKGNVLTYNQYLERNAENFVSKGTLENLLRTRDYLKNSDAETTYSKINETGSLIELSIDNSTYIMSITLKDKNSNTLSSDTIDLPLETMVVDAYYDKYSKEIVLTLKSGTTTRFSVADLVSGLQSEITSTNKLKSDLVDDNKQTNKFVTTQEKTTWNNKSDFSGSYNDLTNKPDLTIYEEKTNKITTLSEESTDTQYPSGKCVYESQEEQNEEIDRLKMVYNALSSEDATGESITIDGTAEVPFRKVDLKGNTSQNTTTGKNLFSTSTATTTVNGITCTNNGDGTYTLNGTATNNVNIDFLPSITIPSGTYKAVGCPSGGSTTTYYLATRFDGQWGDKDTGNGAIITFTNFGKLSLSVASGVHFTNAILKPMITADTSLTYDDYEPYTNGASPNPDYPQDIRVVSGDNTINICGKNLFNGAFELGGIDINNGNNDSASDRVRTKEYIPIQPNTEYTISGVKASRFAIFYDSNKGYLGYSLVDSKATSGTITTLTNTAYIRWYVIQTNTNVNEQLELGTTATTYAPYQSKSYAVNLGTMELCKIGDYQDRIVKDNGKWYKYCAIKKMVLKGSGNTQLYGDGGSNVNYWEYFRSNIVPGNGKSITNYFNQTTYSRVVIINSGTLYLRFPKNAGIDVSTNNLMNNWLSTHNTDVYYVLATPTYEEITDTTLINQLNALANANSYDEQTNISQVNNDLPFIITAEAVLSLQEQITDNLTDYVKNTDYATANKAGVVKIDGDRFGINLNINGIIYPRQLNYTDYLSKEGNFVVAKATLENVITGKGLTTKAYVDNLVGDIESILTTLDVGGGV